jgi:hypothetical protein
MILFNLEVKGYISDLVSIDNCKLELGMFLDSSFIKEFSDKLIELMVLTNILNRGMISKYSENRSFEVCVYVHVHVINKIKSR